MTLGLICTLADEEVRIGSGQWRVRLVDVLRLAFMAFDERLFESAAGGRQHAFESVRRKLLDSRSCLDKWKLHGAYLRGIGRTAVIKRDLASYSIARHDTSFYGSYIMKNKQWRR